MLTYDYEELIRQLNPASGDVTKGRRLRVICRIAMMIRKFEKAGSDRYKSSLHFTFDKQKAMSQLKDEGANKQLTIVSRVSTLVYFIRKFDLNWSDVKSVYSTTDFVTDTAIGYLKSIENQGGASYYETMYLFSLALKYLCRNSGKAMTSCPSALSVRVVLDLVSVAVDGVVKTELVWTLGYIVASCCSSSDNQIRSLW